MSSHSSPRTVRQVNSSFAGLSDEQLEAHMNVAEYGNFKLTDAVRPAYDLEVVPTEGYRYDYYLDPQTGARVPAIIAAASAEKLFDLFFDLTDALVPGSSDSACVDVVLETSHREQRRDEHRDLYREAIDLPVLKSLLLSSPDEQSGLEYNYENSYQKLLLDDGCAGIAVLNPDIPAEIQLEEHKLIVIYGNDLSTFESILADYNLSNCPHMRFINDAEHIHTSDDQYIELFEQLALQLGISG